MKKLIVLLAILTNILSVSVLLADLNENLVAYFPFNGDTDDYSGNNNSGVAFGDFQYIDNHKMGKAIKFNGENSYIQIKNPLQVFDSEYTISAWVLTEGQGGVIFSKYSWGVPGGGKGFTFVFTTESGSGDPVQGTTLFTNALFNEGWNPSKYPKYTLEINKFYYVSAVYNKGNMKLYVNGLIVSEKNIKHGVSLNNSFDILLGTYLDQNGSRVVASWRKKVFAGFIDELRIYNRSLSSTEIIDLYNQNLTASVSGCINLKQKPIKSGKAMLMQSGEIFQSVPLDTNGCYKFYNVNESKPFGVMIRRTLN